MWGGLGLLGQLLLDTGIVLVAVLVLLLGLALVRARDIGSGDRDEVGGRSGLGDGGSHPGGAEQVDLDGLGERGVEGDGGSGVDDDVGGC